MKRLSEDEAQIYIPCSEDYYNNPPAYFTTYADFDGWDVITYYTSKKRAVYYGMEGKNWVYVLSNPSMPDIVKIGYTKLDPQERSNQIGRGTGIPQEFYVEWAYKCFNGEEIEREVHKYLKKQRVNTNKEFFRVSVGEAKRVIMLVGVKYI
jgi:hypothetical protein